MSLQPFRATSPRDCPWSPVKFRERVPLPTSVHEAARQLLAWSLGLSGSNIAGDRWHPDRGRPWPFRFHFPGPQGDRALRSTVISNGFHPMTGMDSQVTTPKPFNCCVFLVRLEGFEPPTLGSVDRFRVSADIRFCPNLESTAGIVSVLDLHRSPMFGSFIPISFPNSGPGIRDWRYQTHDRYTPYRF